MEGNSEAPGGSPAQPSAVPSWVALKDEELLSVRLCEALNWEDNAEYARRHRDIVKRFGRFPHRNQILGRETSEEEAAFLREPMSSF